MKKILVFLLVIVLLSVCSCRSSKTDTTIHQDNTEQKQTEQEEVSTDKAQVDVNKNVERIIEMMQQMEFNWQKTNYSPPDSTGKQYPTSTETATGTSTRQEKETYNEQLQVQIQEIQETLLPDWRREKVVSACSDLADAGFLNLIEGDNDVLGAILTNAAIAWMDAQGSRRAQTVWSIIKTVFSFLR